MNKKLILLLIAALFLTACEYSTPEMEAEKITAQSDAEIAERESGAKIERENETHALMMEIERAKKTDAVNAARVREYANAYAVAASRVLFVISLFSAAIGFSIGAVGAGIGTAKKAVMYGDLVFPNKQMQFPMYQYKAISTDGQKRLFAMHMGTGEVMRLDITKPADAQMITGMYQTMLHNIDNKGAIGVAGKKGRARDISYIDADHILPPENMMKRFESILELGDIDNAN